MQFDELRKVCQNWFYTKKFVKNPFQIIFTSFTHFEKFVGNQNLRWIAKSLNSVSHFSQNPSNFHSNTSSLDLQSSIVQMRLEGSKMGVYIVIIGEGKLKGHQINGSLPLGNIIEHLTLPQLIPHFDNLHWRMYNFGLPYRIELRFGT